MPTLRVVFTVPPPRTTRVAVTATMLVLADTNVRLTDGLFFLFLFFGETAPVASRPTTVNEPGSSVAAQSGPTGGSGGAGSAPRDAPPPHGMPHRVWAAAALARTSTA